jgi:tetraacyldisaccharide 4'-kinase
MSGMVDGGRLAQRVWRGTSPGARVLRALLLVPAAAYRAAVALRNAAYDVGVLRSGRLPRASLGVGNIAVGGVGKTPVAAFLAGELSRRGATPGILLRGYRGGDEAEEHRARTPGAVVVADPHRRRGAERALAEGADVLILDDCLQHREVRPDALLVVLAAETAGDPMWPLPAGPWREGLRALGRGDGVVVTYKTAAAELAAATARRLAPLTRSGIAVAAGLHIARLVPLRDGTPLAAGWLDGREVVALCGIGEPAPFRSQLERLGARVRLQAYGDHHAFRPADVDAALAAAGATGTVVTTAKDAVKLRPMWPAAAPACLVAELAVHVTYGEEDLARLLDRIGRAAHPQTPSEAAGGPPDRRMTT